VKINEPLAVAELGAMLDRYGSLYGHAAGVRMPEGWRIVSAHVSDFA
jgi:hypothetical protein